MTENANPNVTQDIELEKRFTPLCANCAFALPVSGNLRKKECRWGPPMPTMVPTVSRSAIGGPSQQGFQQLVSFPQVNSDWWCHRHQRKLDA